MPIKGSLQEAGLAEVCQLLSMGQKTGCLSVTDGSRFGQIYFDGGRITYASIVNRRDRLGDLLLREEAITSAQLRAAVDAQATHPGRRLGQMLVDQGAIDDATLRRYLARHIEEAVYFLFTWRRGEFYFEAGKRPARGETLISVNPETLLLEGARRVDEWQVIRKKIPSLDLVFSLEADRVRRAEGDLTTEQQAILPLLDGKRTVQEVAEEAGLAEFDTGKALYGLVQAGFARRAGRRENGTAEPDPHEARNLGIAFFQTAMLDDAEREFRRILDGDPDDVRARHYLALIALRRGEPVEAEKQLRSLMETVGPRTGIRLNLAYALRLQHRFPDALALLAEAREDAPEDVRVRLAAGATLLFGGRADDAARVLADYRGRLPAGARPPATYHYCAGLAALATGRTDEADSLVAEGLEVHDGSAPLHLLAGNIAERRADALAAERRYQRAAEEDPTLAQAHRNLGDLAYRRGVRTEAMDHYRRAAEADPALGDELFTRLGDLHHSRSERAEAIRCWRRAVTLNPGNEAARGRLEAVDRAGG